MVLWLLRLIKKTLSFGRRLAVVFLVSVSLGAVAAHAGPIEEIQKIEQQAGSLEALLNSKPALEQVFQQLQKYYGPDRFSRGAFEIVIKRLRFAIQEIPELKTRLWETGNLGTGFTIEAVVAGSGLVLQNANWESYWSQWMQDLAAEGANFSRLSPEKRLNQMGDLFAKHVHAMKQFEQSLEGLNKKQREEKQGDFFSRMVQDPELKALSAYLLSEYLSRPQNAAAFQRKTADEILESLRELRSRSLQIAIDTTAGLTFPEKLGFIIRGLIPDAGVLAQKPELFQPAQYRSNEGKMVSSGSTKAGTYAFRPLTRRWLGAFSGIFNDECVGGVCKPAERKMPSLERLLVMALKGSQQLNLEINGRYAGFIRMIPGRMHDEIYASLELMARPLLTTIVVNDAGTEKRKARPLLNFALEKLSKLKFPQWKGFVVGTLRNLNNANSQNFVQASPYYVMGKDMGRAEYFENIDPLAERIPQLERPSNAMGIYLTGNMIYDAKIAYQGTLTALRMVPENEVHSFLADPKRLAMAFATMENRVRRNGLVEMIAASGTQNPEIHALLMKELMISRPEKGVWAWDISYRDTLMSAIERLNPRSVIALRPLFKGLRANQLDLDEPKSKDGRVDLPKRVEQVLLKALDNNPPAQVEFVDLLDDPHETVRNRAFRILTKLPRQSDESVQKISQIANQQKPKVSKVARDVLDILDQKPSATTISPRVFQQLAVAPILDPGNLENLGRYIIAAKPDVDEISPRLREQYIRATQKIMLAAESGMLSLQPILAKMDPKLRQAAVMQRKPAPVDVSQVAPIDGSEKLAEGSRNWLRNEQVMHPKNLHPKGTFNAKGLHPAFLQENQPRFPIPYYLIPIEMARFIETSQLDPRIREQLVMKIDGGTYAKLFVHPMGESYFRYLKQNQRVRYISPEQTEFMGATTSSYRTLLLWNRRQAGTKSFMVKLGVDVHEQGIHRLVEDSEVIRSTQNEKALEALAGAELEEARLKFFPETAGLILNRADFEYGPEILGGQVVREVPDEVQSGAKQWISFGSLASDEAGERPQILKVMQASGLSSEAFVEKYLVDGFLKTFDRIALQQGLAFQPSDQNLYLEAMADGKPTGYFALRDAEGIYPDAVQMRKQGKLWSLYSATADVPHMQFALGRIYAVQSFVDNYRDTAFKHLVVQIQKYDPEFSREAMRRLSQKLDDRFKLMVSMHFKVPLTDDLKGPIDLAWVEKFGTKIWENTPFERRADAVLTEKTTKIKNYVKSCLYYQKAVGYRLDLDRLKDWMAMDIYTSKHGMEFVDSRGMVAGLIPFDAEESRKWQELQSKPVIPIWTLQSRGEARVCRSAQASGF